MNTDLVLPEALFVPFATRRLRGAYVALATPALAGSDDEAAMLEAYRYIVDQRSVPRAALGARRKTFDAERYGSSGMPAHGGGARVGTDRRFQIKGIGPNPLHGGSRLDFSYATGDMPLGEAVRETIWGEVLHRCLPYGAVRCPMAIGTGLKCASMDAAGRRTAAERGLSIREFALRPAHFMRAIYYRPRTGPGSRLPLDSARVREAIVALPTLLPPPEGWQPDELARMEPVERLYRGLGELSLRFARQHAVARARRFMHGAITASNLALDGRWIDYGSVSRNPVHASGRHFAMPFWGDHQSIETVLRGLAWHIGKYFPSSADDLPDGDALVGLFTRDFNRELKSAFAWLAGFPEAIATRVDQRHPAVSAALGVGILKMARQGGESPFMGDDDDHDAFARYGSYDVGDVLVQLASTLRSPPGTSAVIPPVAGTLGDDLAMAHRAYADAAAQVAAERGMDRTALADRVVDLARRRSAPFPLLSGARVMRAIHRIEADANSRDERNAGYRALLDDALSMAAHIVEEDGTVTAHRKEVA